MRTDAREADVARSGSLSKSKKTDRGKPEKRSPQKAASDGAGQFYKIGDVCALTDTQPYVLRFWESEFPQLAPRKSRSGQRLYEKGDVDLVLKIKKLLYEEEYTIAGARKRLEEEGYAGGGIRRPGSRSASRATGGAGCAEGTIRSGEANGVEDSRSAGGAARAQGDARFLTLFLRGC
jgi:hypothetical protein